VSKVGWKDEYIGLVLLLVGAKYKKKLFMDF